MLKEIFKPTLMKVVFAFGVAVLYLIIVYSIPYFGLSVSYKGDSLFQTLLNLTVSVNVITLLYYPMSCGLFGICAAIKKKSEWWSLLIPILVVLLWNPVTFNYMLKVLIKPKPSTVVNQQTEGCSLSVVSISDFSLADDAGLRVGDVVTGVDGVKITSVNDLIANSQKKQPGDKTSLETDHGIIIVELAEDPQNGGPVLGVKFKEINCR
ncbi:hypothetical protein CO015_04330 [candidate division WWE3 bacterium CG_4_8_14_3_um_filter_42_11]|uniref:PDZ domain-containing protein n=1 Tax=candidate division WWE3 bacterium CG_4_8_14_3_um_filter_42_11 TaxID=1975076 RepID=A0A2M8G6J6_UNCKA|nr:MAG: hypothetical protein CO015_04330 [candidate division WWE3 bacterium CG_4_8_14_3_um_filter_42_11]